MSDKNDYQVQKKLKEYLNKFYEYIWNIRLRIEIHKEIGNVAGNDEYIKYNAYFGFVQSHENVSSAVRLMFAIFDDKKSNTFKKFCGFLRANHIHDIQENDLKKWCDTIEPYEKYRNQIIAHMGIEYVHVPEINYQIFLDVLCELEEKLRKIHKKFITIPHVRDSIWNDTQPNEKSPIISALRDLLVNRKCG